MELAVEDEDYICDRQQEKSRGLKVGQQPGSRRSIQYVVAARERQEPLCIILTARNAENRDTEENERKRFVSCSHQMGKDTAHWVIFRVCLPEMKKAWRVTD